MSRSAPDTPLQTVDDVLQCLKSHWQANRGDLVFSANSPTEAYESLQKHCLGLSPLPIQDLLPEHHRIQFSIRGQRFEMPQSIALRHFLLFFLFFWLPLKKGGSPDTDADNASGISFTAEGRAERTCSLVAQLVSSDGSGTSVASLLLCTDQLTRVLTRHYEETVSPCLVKILELLCHDNQKKNVRDLNNGHSSAVQGSNIENVESLPPIPMVKVVSWDGATQQWRFVFLNRMPDEVGGAEQEELSLCQGCKSCPSVSRSGGKAVAGETSVRLIANENPLLLLQPHYVGTILVYVRRLNQALAGLASGKKTKRWPALAIRWDEFDYDQQLCVSQVVRALGVIPLLATHSAPNASITTSQYLAENAEAHTASGDECGTSPPGGLDSVSQLETGTKATLESEEDWIRQGCAQCGISGHSTVDCPY